jgi:uncharacterized membrane protein YgcG
MLPEDRLDALLSHHSENGRVPPDQPATTDLNGHDSLQPLLDAADQLTDLASVQPSPEFIARLEAQFLAEAAYLQEQAGAEPPLLGNDMTTLPGGDPATLFPSLVPPILGNDAPTLPGIIWAAVQEDGTELDSVPGRLGSARRPARHARLLWPALAAALLLVISATTFTVAAAASPGTVLYGLHRWEQSVQVRMAGSAADRTNLHLNYAQSALGALDAAVARHDTGAAYDDALTTYRDEMQAAATSAGSVPTGSEQDTLFAQLRQLTTRGRADLHSALGFLAWSERVQTTAVLADIGDSVLHVTQVSMVYAGHGQHLWQVTVSGTDFQQGAVLLVNGRPAGTVISVTPTTLVAQLSGDDSAPLPSSMGIANPDDTAALTSNVSSHEQENVTPSPQQTPSGDDHGGDRGGDGHGGNSGPGGGSGGYGASGGSNRSSNSGQ